MDVGSQPNQFTNVILPIISAVLTLLGIVVAVGLTYWQVKTMQRLAGQVNEKLSMVKSKRRGGLGSYLKDSWPNLLAMLPSLAGFFYEWSRPDGPINRWAVGRLICYGMGICIGLVCLMLITVERGFAGHQQLFNDIVDHLGQAADDRKEIWQVLGKTVDVIAGAQVSQDAQQGGIFKVLEKVVDVTVANTPAPKKTTRKGHRKPD